MSADCPAASRSPRPSLTLISTRTGRRTSIHHDTEFADRMNAYIVSPLIPLPKPPAPTRSQRRRNPTLDRLLQPPQDDPTTMANASASQQLLSKLRSLKLRLQRHASLHGGRGWPPRDFVLMQKAAARCQAGGPHSARGDVQQQASQSQSQTPPETPPVDGIVCTESDIRCIVGDLLQRQGTSRQHRQLISVVPLPPPESPTRRLVCYIDPRRSQLVPDSGALQVCHSCLRPLPQEQQRPPPQPKEVLFDENGQTWDVYGADLDPDLLGRAIQDHLAAAAARRQQPEAQNGDAD